MVTKHVWRWKLVQLQVYEKLIRRGTGTNYKNIIKPQYTAHILNWQYATKKALQPPPKVREDKLNSDSNHIGT